MLSDLHFGACIRACSPGEEEPNLLDHRLLRGSVILRSLDRRQRNVENKVAFF